MKRCLLAVLCSGCLTAAARAQLQCHDVFEVAEAPAFGGYDVWSGCGRTCICSYTWWTGNATCQPDDGRARVALKRRARPLRRPVAVRESIDHTAQSEVLMQRSLGDLVPPDGCAEPVAAERLGPRHWLLRACDVEVVCKQLDEQSYRCE